MKVTCVERFAPSEEAVASQGFADYSLEQGCSSLRLPLATTAYDAGVLVVALDGYLLFDWLTISRLWVAATYRGQDVGTRLMGDAEAWAAEHGASGITLATYEYQARAFYENLGFEVFGTLPNNPSGFTRHFMRKTIA